MDEQYAEFDLAMEKSRERLRELGVDVSVGTFFTMTGHWAYQIGQPPGMAPGAEQFVARQYRLDRFSGDVIDLGNKSWIIAGVAYGQTNDRPPTLLEVPYNVEYLADRDRLEIRFSNAVIAADAVSSPDSPIQMRADVSVPRILFVLRRHIRSGYHLLVANSYLQVGP